MSDGSDFRPGTPRRRGLERAIDTAARGLVTGEPGPEMRERVLARIRGEARARPRFLVPALAAAAVVAIVGSLVVREATTPPASRSPQAAARPSLAPAPTATPSVAEARVVEPSAASRPPAHSGAKGGRSEGHRAWAAVAGGDADPGIHPLPAPSPLTPAALPAVAVALDPIRIDGQELAPLRDIEPLSPASQEEP